MYCINATRTITSFFDGYKRVKQVPTFYLDENVQGITDESHALAIAREIIGASLSVVIEVNVTATKCK